jgi:hypothetical protein
MTFIPENAEQFFLRFTEDVESDFSYGKSIWITYEDEKPEPSQGVSPLWNEEYGCWCFSHKGLSGHALEADTLEDAIKEVEDGRWFSNIKSTSWAIFAGDDASHAFGVDTPEGDDFSPIKIMHYQTV